MSPPMTWVMKTNPKVYFMDPKVCQKMHLSIESRRIQIMSVATFRKMKQLRTYMTGLPNMILIVII
ncbi:hypothetical protein LINPERPRIM_LOCUS24271 [Linum perenne]